MEIRFQVTGMSCKHCVGRVKKTLEAFASVSEVTVDLENQEAIVRCTSDTADTDGMIKEVKALGFEISKAG